MGQSAFQISVTRNNIMSLGDAVLYTLYYCQHSFHIAQDVDEGKQC